MALHIFHNCHRLAKVRHLIQTGCDVNAYDNSGWTPLLRTAYHGDVEVARELIRANADANLKVKGSGRSVLYTAAYYICQAWVKFYLLVMSILRMGEQAAREVVSAKADFHWKSKGSGRTALHIAAYYGHQSLVKLFLQTRVNINEQDDEGRTALMLAVKRGHSAVVAELVKAGADISLKDKKRMTAVLMAKNYEMVGQLVQDVNDLSMEDRSRILWHACDFGDLSMVQSVIEASCDVDHIHKGQTPVMMATLRGHDRIVKELILANCDVNFKVNVIFSDFAITTNLERLNQAKISYWIVAMFCALLPCMKFQMDEVATYWVEPVLCSVVLLVMLVVAVVWILIMPRSCIVMFLGSGMVGMVITMTTKGVMMAKPITWAIALVFFFLLMPLVMWRRKVSRSTIINEVVGTVLTVFVGQGAVLLIMFLVQVILVSSPQDMTEAVVGMLIIMVVLALMAPVWLDILVVGLEGVEVVVIALSCTMFARKIFAFHGSETAQGIAGLLFTVLIVWCLLIVLRNEATEMALFRGAAGFIASGIIKLMKMGDTLVSLDLLLMALVVFRMSEFMLATVTKKAVLKRVIVVLHVVVAVAEEYLAVVISKEGPELQAGTVTIGEFINLTVVMVLVLCIQVPNDTALHHAAAQNRTNCGVLLVEAGADKSASDRLRLNPLEMGSKTFVHDAQKAYAFTTRRVIAVIGNSGHGKSTLVTALEHTSDNPWKKAVYRFKKVHDISQRTTGIEAVQVSNQKFGEALFYDFAGQSQYHGPHQSFLEAMLSKPGVSVTLLLLVKATNEEDIITQQLYRWLQSLATTSNLSTPKVVVVGSFLDQVKSKKEAFEKLLRCSQSVKTELCLDIQGPCLLDCHQPESIGIDQICTFLQEACLVNTRASTYNLHWVWVKMQKTFSVPALPFHEFQTWLQDNAVNLSRYLPSPEKVCQDLSEAGHIFFLNERDASNSWLILKLQALLHDVYGTLFSGSLVNKFGLLHCSELDGLFPKLNPGLIQKVLISLEFCIQIDPAQLKEESQN